MTTVKKGFTIIELLVAAAILGMLVTILTMIFNQSSIAWRVGEAGVSNMKNVRCNIGQLEDERDNALYMSEASSKSHRLMGIWDANNNLRSRAVSASYVSESRSGEKTLTFVNPTSDNYLRQGGIDVGSGTAKSAFNAYIVNVKSGGPNKDINDWQAIWSFPDDPNEW